jgi:hypothetical protein
LSLLVAEHADNAIPASNPRTPMAIKRATRMDGDSATLPCMCQNHFDTGLLAASGIP